MFCVFYPVFLNLPSSLSNTFIFMRERDIQILILSKHGNFTDAGKTLKMYKEKKETKSKLNANNSKGGD